MRRELAGHETLEALMPPHARHAVTVGEGVEAFVAPMLPGEHALARVAATLASSDMDMLGQRPIEAAHVPVTRWGRALEALWATGLDRIYGTVIRQAIHRSALELARRPTDATRRKVYGASERGDDEDGPLVTCGYRRAHRPDLNPRLCGRTVTADGVAGWGQVTDGHCTASPAPRFHLTPRRQHLPEVGEPLLVADSTFLAGETIALAAVPRFRLVAVTSASAWVPTKRATRGRPSKEASRPQRRIWRVGWPVQEATEALQRRAQREGRFVLATHVLDAQPLSEADLLRADQGQPTVERSVKWAKNPAAIAPIFLETPTRMVARGGVLLTGG